MALLDGLFKGSLKTVLIVGGVVLAAPKVLPAVAGAARPVAKMLIKGTLSLADSLRELAAEAGEQVIDLLAEVRAERAASAAKGDNANSGPA